MDCKLFLKEKADFFNKMYELRYGRIYTLEIVMEKSLEKNGLAQPFLITPAGLTHAGLRKAFREKIGIDYVFPKELDDLSKTMNERWPSKSYFIRHGGHQEAIGGDEELKLLPAEKIWKRKITTMTSLEVSQFSFEYTLANGAFLDIESVSLASGSCDSNGNVPHVTFCGDKVIVARLGSSNAGSNLRARSAEV